MYSETVVFDDSNDGKDSVSVFNVIKFLDLWIYMFWGSIHYSLVCKNDLFSISGIFSLKGKIRFPIPVGDRLSVSRRIISDMKGRIARCTQMSMTRDQAYLVLFMDFLEYIRLGYAFCTIRYCWSRSCLDHNLINVGHAALNIVDKLLAEMLALHKDTTIINNIFNLPCRRSHSTASSLSFMQPNDKGQKVCRHSTCFKG